jgi:predicted nucleotidyltransferase component of viral defense system
MRVLDRVAATPLAREVVFGGGAALAALHLHHRRSEDVDFFATRMIETAELQPLVRALKTAATQPSLEVVGPRTSLVLSRGAHRMGRIDFAFYPFEPIDRRSEWRGLRVESLLDMTVNKLQAVLTRNQPRDFVDLYFLLREGPERDLRRLLDLVRAKFDVGPHVMGLAARLLLAREIVELPQLIRPVTLRELGDFFEEKARDLAHDA